MTAPYWLKIILSPVSVGQKIYILDKWSENSHTLLILSSVFTQFGRVIFQDLRAINNMLRMNDRTYISGKRLALADEGAQESPVKRFCPNASPAVHKRLEQVLCDRQAANGAR